MRSKYFNAIVYFLLPLNCFNMVNGWKDFSFPRSSRDGILDNVKKQVITGVTGVLGVSGITGVLGVNAAVTPKRLRIAKDENMYLSPQDVLEKNQTFLIKRAFSMDPMDYEPGLEADDVYYPRAFEGKWKVTSSFVEVAAPVSVEAFGGKFVLEAAEKDINSTLEYFAKFKPGSNDTTIADRLYNVESIAQASMGNKSILNDAQLDGNLARRLRLTVSPPSSRGAIFDIELSTTDRQFALLDDNFQRLRVQHPIAHSFEAMERITQTIRVRPEEGSDSDVTVLPLRKYIETITLYVMLDEDTIRGIQRTATFLSPFDPRYSVAYSRNPTVVDTAVDIRRYELLYKRV